MQLLLLRDSLAVCLAALLVNCGGISTASVSLVDDISLEVQLRADGALAEYHREVRLLGPNGLLDRKEFGFDTGGYARCQLFALSNGDFVLRAFPSESIVIDVKRNALTDSPSTGPERFVGAFVFESNVWKFVPATRTRELPLGIPSRWCREYEPPNKRLHLTVLCSGRLSPAASVAR